VERPRLITTPNVESRPPVVIVERHIGLCRLSILRWVRVWRGNSAPTPSSLLFLAEVAGQSTSASAAMYERKHLSSKAKMPVNTLIDVSSG
jgi:hypothetical protein